MSDNDNQENTANAAPSHKVFAEEDFKKILTEEGEIPTALVEKVVQPTMKAHNDVISSLQRKISEVIDKEKRLKSKKTELEAQIASDAKTISELKEQVQTGQKTLQDALENKEDIDVDAMVEKRTNALKSDHVLALQAKDDQISDITLKYEEQIKINRNQLRDYEISKAENQVGVADYARPDFRNRMRDVFNKYDEDENKFVARSSNGEPIFNPLNPSEGVDFVSYAERILKNEAPHLFTQYLNQSMNGNTESSKDVDKFFDERGKVNLAGLEYKKEHGPEKFETMRKKYLQSRKSANN